MRPPREPALSARRQQPPAQPGPAEKRRQDQRPGRLSSDSRCCRLSACHQPPRRAWNHTRAAIGCLAPDPCDVLVFLIRGIRRLLRKAGLRIVPLPEVLRGWGESDVEVGRATQCPFVCELLAETPGATWLGGLLPGQQCAWPGWRGGHSGGSPRAAPALHCVAFIRENLREQEELFQETVTFHPPPPHPTPPDWSTASDTFVPAISGTAFTSVEIIRKRKYQI